MWCILQRGGVTRVLPNTRTALCSLIALLEPMAAANAQSRLVISDQPTAARLRIALSHSMTLREPTGARSWVMPASVARDERGWFYVLDQMGPNPVQVFDPGGRRVRSIPRDELLINAGIVRDIVVAPPDTLHVLSGGDAVFNADGRSMRQAALPEDMMIWNALALSDGRIVVRALIPTPKLFGYPLHLLGTHGTVDRSFGAGKSDPFDGSVPKISGSLALADGRQFWTANMSRYQLSEWTTGGQLVRVVDRRVQWFQAWDGWDGRFDVEPPAPRLVAIRQDAQRRLLTLCNVAASDWKPLPGRRRGVEAPPATVKEFDDANDSVIEVLDPIRGSVLASGRFKQGLIRFIDDSLVAGISFEGGGGVAVDIWKIRLTPQPGGNK